MPIEDVPRWCSTDRVFGLRPRSHRTDTRAFRPDRGWSGRQVKFLFLAYDASQCHIDVRKGLARIRSLNQVVIRFEQRLNMAVEEASSKIE